MDQSEVTNSLRLPVKCRICCCCARKRERERLYSKMSLCENQQTISGMTYPQTQRHKQPNGTHAQTPVSPGSATPPGLTALDDDDDDDDAIAGNCQLHGITVSCFVGILERLCWTAGSGRTAGINARFTKSGCRRSASVRGGGWEGPASQRTSALIKAGGGSLQILPVTIIPEISARQGSPQWLWGRQVPMECCSAPRQVRRWLTGSQRAKNKSGLSRCWRAAVAAALSASISCLSRYFFPIGCEELVLIGSLVAMHAVCCAWWGGSRLCWEKL